MNKLFIRKVAFSILGAITVAVLLLGTNTWNPEWSPFRLDPSVVLAKSSAIINDASSAKLDIVFELQEQKNNKEQWKLSVYGFTHITDTGVQQYQGDLGVSFATEGLAISFEIEYRSTPENAFIKFRTVPALPLLQQIYALLGFNLEELKNQWIRVPADEETIENAFNSEKLEEEILSIINKEGAYTIEELKDEKLEGVMNYHYALTVKNEAIHEISKILSTYSNSRIPNEELTSITDATAKAGNVIVEIWIEKQDFLLRKIKVQKDTPDPNDPETTFLFTASINLSEFNEPVTIEIPESSVLIEELFPTDELFPDSTPKRQKSSPKLSTSFQELYDFFPVGGDFQVCVQNYLGADFTPAYAGTKIPYTLDSDLLDKCFNQLPGENEIQIGLRLQPAFYSCLQNSLGTTRFEQALQDSTFETTYEESDLIEQCPLVQELSAKIDTFLYEEIEY